uniref:NAC domain-containing protein n=1 Tax=Kalanchoe fedtschenkoi TaxID=63787 RepID=A0A7N0TWW2_KALFE
MGEDGSSNGTRRLPPGFRFYPSDEELVVHFLRRKASLLPCHPDVIPDLELYPYDPWQLRGKALEEGNQWYFFSRKQPPSHYRRTNNGYWKKAHHADRQEQPIFSKQRLIGLKRHYVFHIGEAPSGVMTNWIMDEYSLSSDTASSSSKRRGTKTERSKWVVCRVYEQSDGDDEEHGGGSGGGGGGIELSCLDEVFLSLEDELDDISYPSC